jgi:hypothetical protein
VTSDFHSFVSGILHDHGLTDRDEFALRLANALARIPRWDQEHVRAAASSVSTNIHRLHRERTKEETIELIASRLLKRWPSDPRPAPAQTKDAVNILFVAGDRGGSRLNEAQLPREFHAIEDAIRGSEHGDRFRVANPMLLTTHERLVTAYRSRPSIMHFGGHGNDRSLALISDQVLLVGQAPIEGEQLAAILKSFPERVRLCVLNACRSAPIAEYLTTSKSTDFAVGWSISVDDSAAIAFARTLYGGLGDGLSITQAVELADQSCGATESPRLYAAKGTDPTQFSFVERSSK